MKGIFMFLPAFRPSAVRQQTLTIAGEYIGIGRVIAEGSERDGLLFRDETAVFLLIGEITKTGSTLRFVEVPEEEVIPAVETSQHITQLQEELRQLRVASNLQYEDFKELGEEYNRMVGLFNQQNELLAQLQEVKTGLDADIVTLQNTVHTKQNEIESLRGLLGNCQAYEKDANDQIKQLRDDRAKYDHEFRAIRVELSEANERLTAAEAVVAKYQEFAGPLDERPVVNTDQYGIPFEHGQMDPQTVTDAPIDVPGMSASDIEPDADTGKHKKGKK
jgi:chromosome segregation ATPase